MWMNKEGRVPTTDEMDEFDPNEPHAYDCFIQCRSCGGWTMFDRRTEYTLKNRLVCEHCGGSILDPQSTISYRTFDPVRAKKRKWK